MRLEDIDGEVYITDSLLESLREQKPATTSSPKYTVVVENQKVGSLRSYKSCPPIMEIEFDCAIDPGLLITKVSGKKITVTGIDLGFTYTVGEVSCNIETLRCNVKAIHIEEVQDERGE